MKLFRFGGIQWINEWMPKPKLKPKLKKRKSQPAMILFICYFFSDEYKVAYGPASPIIETVVGQRSLFFTQFHDLQLTYQ